MTLYITPTINLDDREIEFEFSRSGGPGGQNVNKVATTVQLRFDAAHSPSLPEAVRTRLMKLAGSRLTAAGVMVIQAHRYRTQEQNRQDALNRLVELIRQAAQKPRLRQKTRPTLAARAKRLEIKHRHSVKKQFRRFVQPDED